MAAYARGAKHARGAVIGQDIFESGECKFLAGRPDTRLDSAGESSGAPHRECRGNDSQVASVWPPEVMPPEIQRRALIVSQQAAIQKNRHR